MKNNHPANVRREFGELPENAPLAMAYVPMQPTGACRYEERTALIKGTLYQALDLPYRGMTNMRPLPETPLYNLMAASFAVDDLGLYLNTHPDDEQAIALFNQLVEREEKAAQCYEQKHGPIQKASPVSGDTFEWNDNPWPWEYAANKEGC